jgi:hypothetical protein
MWHMSKDAPKDLDAERDERFAKAVGKAIAEAMKPSIDPNMTPDERHQMVMRELRGVDRPPAHRSWIAKDCPSEDTGARFDADMRDEIVMTFASYTFPAGIDKNIADGGIVPDGIKVTEEGADYSYRHWRWTNFLQADLRRFVGKPLPPSARPKAA